MAVMRTEYFKGEVVSMEPFKDSARRNFMENGGYFVSHAPWMSRVFSGTLCVDNLIEKEWNKELARKLEQLIRGKPLVEAGCADNPLTSLWKYNPSSVALVDPTGVNMSQKPNCSLSTKSTDVLTYVETDPTVQRGAFCVSTHSFIDCIVDLVYLRNLAAATAKLGWAHFHQLDRVQNVSAFIEAGYRITGMYDVVLNEERIPSNLEDIAADLEYHRIHSPHSIPLQENHRFLLELR